jgi:hypothetical protein
MELLGDVGLVDPRLSNWRQCWCRCQIGARFAPNITQAQKSFWTHTMKLLGDLGRVESRFGLFAHSANLDAKLVHGLRRTYHRL